MAFLGIDLGGTYARAAVVDEHGRILAASKMALTDRTPLGVVAAIELAATDAMTGIRGINRTGVGVAGMLDGETGHVVNAPNLGWRDVPFGAMLAERLGHSVRVVNDLSAAAWGELKGGAGRGASEVFVMFVGSGVGSSIITHGQLVRGATNSAGEFGHVKVVPGGRRCGCGQHGCLEAYAGGHNLIAQMVEALATGRHTVLRTMHQDGGRELTPVLLEEAAQQGDELAKEIFDRASAYLGLAVANMISVLNPERLIIGGGVLSRCSGMRQAIADGVQRYSTEVSKHALHISEAALGDDAGIIGAALLAAEA